MPDCAGKKEADVQQRHGPPRAVPVAHAEGSHGISRLGKLLRVGGGASEPALREEAGGIGKVIWAAVDGVDAAGRGGTMSASALFS